MCTLVLILTCVVSLILAVLLLLHHKCKHGDPISENYLVNSSEQWFQQSDIGKWHSHECWVVLLLTTSFASSIVLLLTCV